MKLIDLLEELKEKDCYLDFKKKYPNSYLTAGFFMLNTAEKEGDSFQIDFFIPSENKMASFSYPFSTFKVHEDEIKDRVEILNLELKVDIPNLQEFVKEHFKKEFSKVIAIIQEDIWNLTCISGMDLKRLKINAYTGEIIETGSLNLGDIIKIKKT